MKILQVCLTYGSTFGGTAEHVRNISERLVKKYETTVCCTDPSGTLPKEELINGVEIKRFKSWAPNGAYFFSTGLSRYLSERSRDFDIIHAHNYHGFPALYAARAKINNSLVFTPHYHGAGATLVRNLLHLAYRPAGKQIFDKADRVVCVSEYERSLIARDFELDQSKVSVIPNGVDPGEFQICSERGGKQGKIILCVSRLEKYKGVDYVVRALPKLDSESRLEIVGTGPHRKALEGLASRLMVRDRVVFSDHLPRHELLRKYAGAGLFVLLSKYEAFGMTVGEALASGTPCIVANTSALREWVDGENCFGIDYPIDIERLARLINEALGRKIRTERLRLPTWDSAVQMLISIFEEVVRPTRTRRSDLLEKD